MRVIDRNGLVYESVDYSPYLAHHGILGQKWGKQNGPPYPLSGSAHSSSEKKAGWRDSLSESKYTKMASEARAVANESLKKYNDTINTVRQKEKETGQHRDDATVKQLNKLRDQKLKDAAIASKLESLDSLEKTSQGRDKIDKKIAKLYERSLKYDLTMSNEKRKKLEKLYLKKITPEEMSTMAKALQKRDSIEKEYDDAFEKWYKSCLAKPEVKKILEKDPWGESAEEYIDKHYHMDSSTKRLKRDFEKANDEVFSIESKVAKRITANSGGENIVTAGRDRRWSKGKRYSSFGQVSGNIAKGSLQRAAYRTIAQKYRSQIVSMYRRGASLREIAEKLGISPSSVEAVYYS